MCQTHLKKNYKIYRILFPPLFQLSFIITKTNSNKYFFKSLKNTIYKQDL